MILLLLSSCCTPQPAPDPVIVIQKLPRLEQTLPVFPDPYTPEGELIPRLTSEGTVIIPLEYWLAIVGYSARVSVDQDFYLVWMEEVTALNGDP
jgi:hypothetical protein